MIGSSDASAAEVEGDAPDPGLGSKLRARARPAALATRGTPSFAVSLSFGFALAFAFAVSLSEPGAAGLDSAAWFWARTNPGSKTGSARELAAVGSLIAIRSVGIGPRYSN